jgi:hypothetical protein
MHELRNIILEKHSRLAQSLLVLGVVGSVLYYRVPVGETLKGMFLGYGLYVAVGLVTLALRVYRELAFRPILATAQPFSYVMPLWIWTTASWTYHPNALVQPSGELEVASACKSLSAQSKRPNQAVQFRLSKAVGP